MVTNTKKHPLHFISQLIYTFVKYKNEVNDLDKQVT